MGLMRFCRGTGLAKGSAKAQGFGFRVQVYGCRLICKSIGLTG